MVKVGERRPGVTSWSTTASHRARPAWSPRSPQTAATAYGPRLRLPARGRPARSQPSMNRSPNAAVSSQSPASAGHHQQPGGGQVALLAIERRSPDCPPRIHAPPPGHRPRSRSPRPSGTRRAARSRSVGAAAAAGRAARAAAPRLAAAAWISPRASWMLVSSSRAALSPSGSPARRASAMPRSISSSGSWPRPGAVVVVPVEGLGDDHPRRQLPGRRSASAAARRSAARRDRAPAART